MQLSDYTTRDKIMNTACSEFLENGYKDASLRTISRKAGVTTGALYGYFKSKKDLFSALVKDQYLHIISIYNDILSEFNRLSPQQQETNMVECTMRGIFRMVDYMYQNKTTFKLILCCSEGTEFSNLVHDMAQLDVSATRQFENSMEYIGHTVKNVNSNLERILTTGMFSAFFELIIQDIPRSEADEYVKQLISFYSAGWNEIMGLA